MERLAHGPVVQEILDKLPTTTLDGGSAVMLPRACYTSPEFFEFEREAVFARSWICVGRVEQIAHPGDYLAASVAREPLLVVRTEKGSVEAMRVVCQHRRQVLTFESGSVRGAFRCPLHFWTYDLHGRLLAASHMGGPEEVTCLRERVRLRGVRVELWHGFVFVSLDPDAS